MFHAHLINKRNVVATAIGRYLIRRTDFDENGHYRRGKKTKRTLENSLVVDISWPCILVFVNQWEDDASLLADHRNDIIPKSVYMPDGRVVPICIVEAPHESIGPSSSVDVDELHFPRNLIGGGYPLTISSQGVERIASLGCVVTDGHKYYALTNKHVAGDSGEVVYSRFGYDKQPIGVTSGLTLGRVSFETLYPGWVGASTLVNCDAGLIEIEDIANWKTDILGLGPFGELYDVSTFTLDLRLITQYTLDNGNWEARSGRVVAYGAVSGKMEGDILALFYRYKSVGGTEFVSDLLIAGRGGRGLQTHHGDSGTLWLLEDSAGSREGGDLLRPIGLQWGQHVFLADGESKPKRFSYALATYLSNVCRQMDVDIVRGWNVDSPYTWGKVGHYTVAAFAISTLTEPELARFMNANLTNITFPNGKIAADLDTQDNPDLPTNPNDGFCPLADVPDIIWKQSKATTGYGRRGDENPNHYADADAPTRSGGTLFDRCSAVDKLTVKVWNEYYDDIDVERLHLDTPVSKGLICFRVWQIFDYMVDALREKRADKFILGAGVLAHYVGDGCQPLHSSYMSNGDPADSRTIQYTAKRTSTKHNKGDVYSKPINPGEGVHSAYEDAMIDAQIASIWPSLHDNDVKLEPIDNINSGQSAGFAVLTLMRKSQETIPPKEIVEAFKASHGGQDVTKVLADKFEDRTVTCLARGAYYLAAIWEAAWRVGDGRGSFTERGKIAPDRLISLYRVPDELPSKHLDTIGSLLKPSP